MMKGMKHYGKKTMKSGGSKKMGKKSTGKKMKPKSGGGYSYAK